MTALLDVNVLIALGWPDHVHHAAARHWFGQSCSNGWATTPITSPRPGMSGFPAIVGPCRYPPRRRSRSASDDRGPRW
jgi:hypothetical protein